MTDNSTAPGDDFAIPADPDVIDGDANDDGQSDIGEQQESGMLPANSNQEGWK